MDLIIHELPNRQIAELKSKDLLLKDLQDFIDLMGNANYLGAEAIIITKANLPTTFLDLKTRIAGEILQKFSNYNLKLAIVGDFKGYESKSLNDFIRESNRVGRILFLDTFEEAMERFQK